MIKLFSALGSVRSLCAECLCADGGSAVQTNQGQADRWRECAPGKAGQHVENPGDGIPPLLTLVAAGTAWPLQFSFLRMQMLLPDTQVLRAQPEACSHDTGSCIDLTEMNQTVTSSSSASSILSTPQPCSANDTAKC